MGNYQSQGVDGTPQPEEEDLFTPRLLAGKKNVSTNTTQQVELVLHFSVELV